MPDRSQSFLSPCCDGASQRDSGALKAADRFLSRNTYPDTFQIIICQVHFCMKNPACLRRRDFGGSWWIRTTEALRSRFTVCPHWPLGKAPLFSFLAARASHLRVLVYYSKGIRKLQAFLKNFFFVVSSFAKLHANFFEISAWIRFFAMRQVLPNTWPKGLDLE